MRKKYNDKEIINTIESTECRESKNVEKDFFLNI